MNKYHNKITVHKVIIAFLLSCTFLTSCARVPTSMSVVDNKESTEIAELRQKMEQMEQKLEQLRELATNRRSHVENWRIIETQYRTKNKVGYANWARCTKECCKLEIEEYENEVKRLEGKVLNPDAVAELKRKKRQAEDQMVEALERKEEENEKESGSEDVESEESRA